MSKTITAEHLRSVEPMSAELTADYLEHYAVFPVGLSDGIVRVATWQDDVDPQALDDMAVHFERRVELVRMPETEVRAAIHRVYGDRGFSASDFIDDLGAVASKPEVGEVTLDDLLEHVNDPPVVKLTNLLLVEALDSRASDIHIEVFADSLRVRYRVDGVLQEAPAPPLHLMPSVISRLKLMAGLSVAERRAPQDGRIALNLGDHRIDVRVSTLPTVPGESLVLRLLDRRAGLMKLQDLGMANDTLEQLKHVIEQSQGIVLATGPAGSGTTTTLYAVIDQIRSGREKILTVEDTVEYELPGVPQVSVRGNGGVSFCTALEAALGQDPDVLLIGEIRDPETADFATRGAQVGHLVFSTLHTNDASASLTHLLDLKVPAYLVASTVQAVLAQRLVRTVCLHCVEERPAGSALKAAFGAASESVTKIRTGRGCDQCRGTGYLGRTGVFELLVVDDEIRSLVQQRSGVGELRRLAIASGMRTLMQDGLRRIGEGVTTPDEVLRVVRS